MAGLLSKRGDGFPLLQSCNNGSDATITALPQSLIADSLNVLHRLNAMQSAISSTVR